MTQSLKSQNFSNSASNSLKLLRINRKGKMNTIFYFLSIMTNYEQNIKIFEFVS